MKKEYVFNDSLSSGKTIIKLNDSTLTISRPGVLAKLSHGFTGEKTILLSQISAIQVKKAGMTRGYIQFTLAGTREAKSGAILGNLDENIVYFTNKKLNDSAEEIKNTIEEYNLKIAQGSNIVVKEEDKYDKLAKLKQLLDNNVITQEEFEKEKFKILN